MTEEITLLKFLLSLLKYPAKASINPILDNSEGWNDIPAIFTHLPAPPEESPIPGILTKNNTAIEIKYISQ